jgi:inner membrane protein
VFVAHVPAGYLLTSALHDLASRAGASRRRLLALGIASSVLPDLDLLYFYLVDHRQSHHHTYWSHVPFAWIVVLAPLLVLARRSRPLFTAALVVAANVFLHLGLDTMAGAILWRYPFSAHPVTLFDVPAGHSWWVWNFVFHWTFALELTIVAAALAQLYRERGRRPPP